MRKDIRSQQRENSMRDNRYGLLTAITIMFVLAVAAVPSLAVTFDIPKGRI